MIKKIKALLSRRRPTPAPEPEPPAAPAPDPRPLRNKDRAELGRMWMNDDITSDEYCEEVACRAREKE